MATTPWTAGEIANAISGRTAIDLRVDRGPAVNPLAFCCTTNTIADSKDPTCLFSVNVQEGNTDTTFTFDATESFAPDGTIITYAWDFGDGNADVGLTTTHRYEEGGDFEVVLTLTDALGLVRSCAVGITVDDGSFPAFNGESRRAWVGQLAQASFCLDLYGGGNPSTPSEPAWTAVTAGLPAGARVNDVSVNPRDLDEVVVACGDPNFAVDGGVFRCLSWGAAFVDITPANPGTWRDGDDNVGGEANRLTAAVITLTDAEWDSANWIFCEADRRWDGNIHAVALVHKAAPSTVIGTFYCIYHAATNTWEVTQLWTNKPQPWYCEAKKVAISWVGGQYVYVVTDGTNLSWSNEWGRTGTWQDTAPMPVGYTVWNDEGTFPSYRGAVWIEYQAWDANDPFDWPSSDELYLAVNEWPYVLHGDAGGVAITWEGWGFTSSETNFITTMWGPPHWGYTNRMGDDADDPGEISLAVERGPHIWPTFIPSRGTYARFHLGERWHTFWQVPDSNSILIGWFYTFSGYEVDFGTGSPYWIDGPAFSNNEAYDVALMEFFTPSAEVPDVVRSVLVTFQGVGGWWVGQTTIDPWRSGSHLALGFIHYPAYRLNNNRSGNLAAVCYSVDVDLWS